MMSNSVTQNADNMWIGIPCDICRENIYFNSTKEFCRHLRDFHCTREGGSYICRYGKNGVCSLAVEGVNDIDYEEHIMKSHVSPSSECTKNDLKRPYTNFQRPIMHSGPSVVQDQYKWTIYNSTVNIPAALNDPRLVKRETDFFTKTWGLDFYEKTSIPVSEYLPEINKVHFESYVKRTSERYKKHAKELSSIAEEKLPETHLSKTVRQAEKNRTEIEQLPKLFFSPHFNLENPDTFSIVFPWTQVEESKVNHPGTRKSSKLLQEKLSHYLDIVEVQIAQQISRRSDAFFHAMTSHDELQDRMKTTIGRIKFLRDKINSLDVMMSKQSLKVLKMAKTRSCYVQLHNKLKLMATVHQTQPTIQTLLSTNDFVGALDLISTTQEVLSQELAGVHCLRHLGSQLAELEKLIDFMIQEEFHKHVTSELMRPVSDPMAMVDEERLVAILFGMLRLHKLQFIDVYREETFTAMKAVVKQTVIEAVTAADDIDTDDNNISLADQMRLLNYTKWNTLMIKIFDNLLVILKRAKAFHGIVTEVVTAAAGVTKVLSSSAAPSTETMNHQNEETIHVTVSVSDDVDVMVSVEDYNKAISGLRDLLYSVCDHAHDRCVKVVAARAKDGFMERLTAIEFVALFREVEKFVTDCETVCGRRSMSLRGSLQSQANRFINRFHDERKNKLSLILDNERWKQADVPAEFQDLVNHLSISGQLSIPESKIVTVEKGPGEYLVVDGQTYAVVGTVLMLLKMVIEYCQCAEDIPIVVADLLTRLIELLKIFNSRTCQLVLGAGALQLVGLKTISTRNLALASRCLQLVVNYMPIVRTHFEQKLSNKNITLLKHFDQIMKDYKDHIDEISNKLVTIMESMVDSQLSRWEVKAPMPSRCFRAICKQMAKLHEAIIDILPEVQVRDIFVRINDTFKMVLRQQLVHLNVINNGGPQHALVTSDLTFYSGSFKTLRGLENVAQDVNDVWDKW